MYIVICKTFYKESVEKFYDEDKARAYFYELCFYNPGISIELLECKVLESK